MGHINDLNFVKSNMSIVKKGPVLEVGSKSYPPHNQDYRSLFPGCDYVGVDMEEGENVDVVLDLTKDFNVVNRKLGNRKFKTIIMFSVLEHCRNPWKLARNITKLLDHNGILFVNAPFCHHLHSYPGDYWRFTPDAIKILFDLDFDTHEGNISTGIIGETRPIDTKLFKIALTGRKALTENKLTGVAVLALKKLSIMSSVFKHNYVFPTVMVNMIGIKKEMRRSRP